MESALRAFSDEIRATALKDGQNVSNAAVYVNYALFRTPLNNLYGKNVERLHGISEDYDPHDVMGLAGDWKF
jgi:hypothetical protein